MSAVALALRSSSMKKARLKRPPNDRGSGVGSSSSDHVISSRSYSAEHDALLWEDRDGETERWYSGAPNWETYRGVMEANDSGLGL